MTRNQIEAYIAGLDRFLFMHGSCHQPSASDSCMPVRGELIWEFWVLTIPIIFLSKSTDTDHQSDIDLAHVKQ